MLVILKKDQVLMMTCENITKYALKKIVNNKKIQNIQYRSSENIKFDAPKSDSLLTYIFDIKIIVG